VVATSLAGIVFVDTEVSHWTALGFSRAQPVKAPYKALPALRMA